MAVPCSGRRGPEAARTIDGEERKLVEEAADRVRQVLTTSRDALEWVTQALLDEKTVTSAQLEMLAAAAPIRRGRPGVPIPPEESHATGSEAS